MAQQQILAQEDARIGLQSTGGGRQMLRSRIPTDVFKVLEAQDGEYFHWTVFPDMQAALAHIPKGVGVVIGYIISEEDANPRDIIAEKQTGAAKKSAKKGASKKGGVKVARKPAPVEDDAFAEEEDDGSAPPTRRPVAVAVARRPVAVQTARAPIAKPGVSRKGRKVRYRE
jgi:hypothetical protein